MGENKMKNGYVIMSGVNALLLILLTTGMMKANNCTIAELEKSNAKVFSLTEELSEKDTTINNLNEIIGETEDDVKSLEIQYEEKISALEDENDTLTILYAKEKENLMSVYESMLTEDQRFLAEYVAEGGEIEDIGEWKCTAYCTEKRKHICGTGSGITASGEPVQANWSVAVNKSNLDWLPFGTHIYIEGVGERVVMDTGGGVKTNQFDCANGTHAEALAWSGAGNHRAWILK